MPLSSAQRLVRSLGSSRGLWLGLPLAVGVAGGCFAARQMPATAQVATGPAGGADATAATTAVTETTPVAGTIPITVDKRVQLQQIAGFGAFGGKDVPWSNPPFYDAAFVKTVINDLGLTILRDEVPTTLEKTNDNSDPFNTDLSKYNLTQGPSDACEGSHQPLAPHLDYLKAMQQEAKAKGEPLLFIASIWSPPKWMKYVKCVFGGDLTWNRLIVKERLSAEKPNDYKDEFAEYCVAYVKLIKQHTGVDVYALSLQNEPAFAQSYQSAVYSPEEMRNIIRHVGLRFDKEGIKTKIFAPEDVPDYQRVSQYMDAIYNDAQASSHLGIIAVHGYGPDGMAAGTTTDEDWKRYYELAAQGNKPLWMTETSGHGKDWNGAMQLAQSIYSGLKFGRLSAWVFWQLSEQGAGLALMDNGKPTARYEVSKQFYRYIRPGAVQIETNSPDPEVKVVGFAHRQHKTTTLVLINSGNTPKKTSLKLVGANLPASFRIYRATEGQPSAPAGVLPASGVLELPARSVTTLVGTSAAVDAPLAPKFRESPQPQTVSEGQGVRFASDVVGTPGIAYQWKRNGIDIPGANGASYGLKSVVAADNGAKYTLVAKNAVGTITSIPATLTVTPFAGLNIARTSVVPAVDSKIDAAWGSATATAITKPVIGGIRARGDLSGNFKALWDDTNLYLLTQVTDDKVWSPQSGAGDSFEIVLDGDNSKLGSYDANDFQFVLGYDKAPAETKHNATAGVTSFSARTSDGYLIETKIPWKTLGVTPRAGLLLGFDVNVNDSDGEDRTGKIAWFSTSNDIWFNPSLAGVAKLVAKG